MKLIGYTANKSDWWTTYSDKPTTNRPVADWFPLYIRDNNENVNADIWEHIGWIYPAEVHTNVPPYVIITGERPSTNSVAAYIERQRDVTPADPINIDALAKRLETLEEFAKQVDAALELFAKQLANNRELDHIPPADTMTFYDHAFLMVSSYQLHKTGIVDTNLAHVMVDRLTAARRPATGA